MLPRHKETFFSVADHVHCWIGLREPNELSDKWIGLPGCTPKGEKCKAKSSDNFSYRHAGLVVDPVLCPEAFLATTLADAVSKWREKFAVNNILPAGFTRVESGPEKGLVKYHGNAIHADFDLMLLSKADANGELIFTNYAEQTALFNQVMPLINQSLGSPMIQHGPEFAWRDGVGARASEDVWFFGPKRAFKVANSSMPQLPGTMH